MITYALLAIAAAAAFLSLAPANRKKQPAAFVADVRPVVAASDAPPSPPVPSVAESVAALQTLRLRLAAVGLTEEEIRQRLEPVAPVLLRELKQ